MALKLFENTRSVSRKEGEEIKFTPRTERIAVYEDAIERLGLVLGESHVMCALSEEGDTAILVSDSSEYGDPGDVITIDVKPLFLIVDSKNANHPTGFKLSQSGKGKSGVFTSGKNVMELGKFFNVKESVIQMFDRRDDGSCYGEDATHPEVFMRTYNCAFGAEFSLEEAPGVRVIELLFTCDEDPPADRFNATAPSKNRKKNSDGEDEADGSDDEDA